LVYSEFGERADTLWAAAPDDPRLRAPLDVIEHAPGFGIYPSLSPDGTAVAYTVAPRTSAGDTGELRVFSLDTGSTALLASGVDVRIAPVWSPEGDAVAVRRSAWGDAGGSFAIVRAGLDGSETPLVTSDAGLFPIDFSPDGAWLYFAALSPEGTDLARVPAAGGAGEQLAHLSDGVARDWHLSPDGRRLAYLAQPSPDAGATLEARVLNLATGEAVSAGSAAGDSAQFNPVWEASGALTIGTLERGEGGGAQRLDSGGAASSATQLAAPQDGFDVPLSWSPDGQHLAVRSFAGTSVADPGPSRVTVIDTGGARYELPPGGDVAIAGWLPPSQ
jgi:Tol biopolymer transport system component